MENDRIPTLREALDDTVGVLYQIRDAFRNGTGGVPMYEVNDVIEAAEAALKYDDAKQKTNKNK